MRPGSGFSQREGGRGVAASAVSYWDLLCSSDADRYGRCYQDRQGSVGCEGALAHCCSGTAEEKAVAELGTALANGDHLRNCQLCLDWGSDC